MAALLQDPGRSQLVDKELRTTLAGKVDAMSRLAPRVAPRDGPHIQHHVARTDGAEALQQQLVAHFPQYTLVLDIIHATEYLWDTANALLGETHPPLNRAARGRTGITRASTLILHWLEEYNHERPHGALDGLTPAAFAARCRASRENAA